MSLENTGVLEILSSNDDAEDDGVVEFSPNNGGSEFGVKQLKRKKPTPTQK